MSDCLQVVDLLIFKGREELETYLMMHKQRHHLVRTGKWELSAHLMKTGGGK